MNEKTKANTPSPPSQTQEVEQAEKTASMQLPVEPKAAGRSTLVANSDEDEHLKPFRAFRSVEEFRKIYDELTSELESKK
jgi:hypothetical protein